jgi:TonB family protein
MTVMTFGYIVLFTLLLAGGAAAVEHAAQGRAGARHLWTAAIALAIVAPPALLVWHAMPDRSDTVRVDAARMSNELVTVAPTGTSNGAQLSAMARLQVSVNRFLAGHPSIAAAWSDLNHDMAGVALAVWGMLSLTLVGWVAFGVRHWRRASVSWQRRTVDGMDVDVSPSTGPAVMGFVSNRIVLPEWATAMQPAHRRLVLAHESEHISARDPQRLAMAVAALIAMPWNIGLWWCAARLRRAIELDCDARVLQRFPDAKEYGYVLLEVAARGRTSGPLAVPMVGLLRLPSELEQRLCAMTRSRTIGMRSTMLGGLAALVAITAAFAAPVPSVQEAEVATNQRAVTHDSTTERARIDTLHSGAFRLHYGANDRMLAIPDTGSRSSANDTVTYRSDQVDKQVQRISGGADYPATLRRQGIEGTVEALFVVDTTGHVTRGSVTIERATNDDFAVAVRTALPDMLFTPAELGGRRVRQLVEQPFVFAIIGEAKP